MKRKYKYNPAKNLPGRFVGGNINKTIDQCLKSSTVKAEITEFCDDANLSYLTLTSLLRELAHAGRAGATTIGQSKIAERLRISVRTVSKYYLAAVDGGFIYREHRARSTPQGVRRTTNTTILTVLIDYCERCSAFIRNHLNFKNQAAARLKSLNAPNSLHINLKDSTPPPDYDFDRYEPDFSPDYTPAGCIG